MPRKTNRDEFTAATKQTLAQRVGNCCSLPTCRATTSGPQLDPDGAVNVGRAAHITAASNKGPRYDKALTSAQRKHASNGIWVCAICADIIDKDLTRFTVEELRVFKIEAEREASAN